MDECIFCKIVKGEIPSYKVWEDDNNLAFLTIEPIKEGHTLVIPKKHNSYIFDMDKDDLNSLMNTSKEVAKKLKIAFKPKSGKIGVVVYGLDINHVHVHLIPIDNPGDLEFGKAKKVSFDKLNKIKDLINLN